MNKVKDWMVFVDGENLVARATSVLFDLIDEVSREDEEGEDEALARYLENVEHNYVYQSGDYFWGKHNGDSLVSYSSLSPLEAPRGLGGFVVPNYAVRAYYYATCGNGHGEDKKVRKALKKKGFQPHVWQVGSGERKTFDELDVQLATDLIGNAYRNNYEIGILVSGDGDYVPAVREAQRQGKVIGLAAFFHDKGGVNPKLRRQCDFSIELRDAFLEH